MKKPINKSIEIHERIGEGGYFALDRTYNSDGLREIADNMDEDGIIEFTLCADAGYNNIDFWCDILRMESEEETEKRYKKQIEEYRKYQKQKGENKERRKLNLIKEAKKLGLKVVEE